MQGSVAANRMCVEVQKVKSTYHSLLLFFFLVGLEKNKTKTVVMHPACRKRTLTFPAYIPTIHGKQTQAKKHPSMRVCAILPYTYICSPKLGKRHVHGAENFVGGKAIVVK